MHIALASINELEFPGSREALGSFELSGWSGACTVCFKRLGLMPVSWTPGIGVMKFERAYFTILSTLPLPGWPIDPGTDSAHQLREGLRPFVGGRRRYSPPRCAFCRKAPTVARLRKTRTPRYARPGILPSALADTPSQSRSPTAAGQKVDLLPHLTDRRDRLAEVQLGITGWMRQQHECLPAPRLAKPRSSRGRQKFRLVI